MYCTVLYCIVRWAWREEWVRLVSSSSNSWRRVRCWSPSYLSTKSCLGSHQPGIPTHLHRRIMETEGKEKVVASVWRAKLVQFLAALDVLSRTIWKKRLNSSLSFKSTEAKQQLARQEIEQIMPPKQTWRPLPFLLFSPFFYARLLHCSPSYLWLFLRPTWLGWGLSWGGEEA